MVLGRGTAHRVPRRLGGSGIAGSAATRDAGLGIWHDESAWFSRSVQSRKARNLRADPRCVVTTDYPIEPVVVEGVAEVVRELGAIEEMVSRLNAKYSSDITVEFMDPDGNATFRVRPRWVFSLNDKEFTESPIAGSSEPAQPCPGRSSTDR